MSESQGPNCSSESCTRVCRSEFVTSRTRDRGIAKSSSSAAMSDEVTGEVSKNESSGGCSYLHTPLPALTALRSTSSTLGLIRVDPLRQSHSRKAVESFWKVSDSMCRATADILTRACVQMFQVQREYPVSVEEKYLWVLVCSPRSVSHTRDPLVVPGFCDWSTSAKDYETT